MNKDLKKFTITHHSEQEIIITVPSLFCDVERALILQTVLLMQEAIEEVKIDIDVNSVSVQYNPTKLSREKLLTLLESLLKNFSKKPKKNLKQTEQQNKNSGEIKQTIDFEVGGMSCNSCALFLEMTLSRNPDISLAQINYESRKGVVKGFLKQEEIFQIIEQNGYQAHSIDLPS